MVYFAFIKSPEPVNGITEEPYWLATRNADYFGRAFPENGTWSAEIRKGKNEIRVGEGLGELEAIRRLIECEPQKQVESSES